MANIQTIKLGGFVDEEVKKLNENFTALDEAIPEVPTNVGAFTNDAGYQTAEQVATAITEGVSVPTKMSDLENDANYVKSTDPGYLNKVDAETGKGLSTNDYTNDDKAKVDKIGKIDFTASNFTTGTDGYKVATLPAASKYPAKVMRKNGAEYEEVLVHTKVSGDNLIIVSSEAFEGYVVTL